MAETKYTYSIENDFPNQAVCETKLFTEIGESNIVTECSHINTHVDNCDVYFTDVLSSGDETTLSDIVSVHDGMPVDQAGSQIYMGPSPDVNSPVWLDPSSNFFYCFDSVRESWLSSNKDYPVFSKKGSANGMYLPLVTEFSLSSVSNPSDADSVSTVGSLDEAYMPGKPATITGIFCRSKRGNKSMKFDIKKNSSTIFTFEYDGSGDLIYNNTDLNLEIDTYDEIQIYVYRKGSSVINTLCRLEIAWRYV